MFKYKFIRGRYKVYLHMYKRLLDEATLLAFGRDMRLKMLKQILSIKIVCLNDIQ